jgi:ferritin-like metal-binding protein YciE
MAETTQELLIAYIEDAHALEQMVDKALTEFISSAPDLPEFQDPLTHHKEETQQHIQRLESRLQAYGKSPSKAKDAALGFGAVGLAAVDRLRKDNAGKIARDGYVAEHLEIAAYKMLERVASRVGDDETAEVARLNRADDEAMAAKLDASWDLAVDVSLQQEGVRAAAPFESDSAIGAEPPEQGTAQ